MAQRDAAGVRLFTRNGHDFAKRFPTAAAAVAALAARSCLIDGEAIVTDQKGLAVFDLIRGRQPSAAAVLCAFDLLELDGEDLRLGDLPPQGSTGRVRLPPQGGTGRVRRCRQCRGRGGRNRGGNRGTQRQTGRSVAAICAAALVAGQALAYMYFEKEHLRRFRRHELLTRDEAQRLAAIFFQAAEAVALTPRAKACPSCDSHHRRKTLAGSLWAKGRGVDHRE